MITFTEKNTVGPQARVDEGGVLDEQPMKADDFRQSQIVLAGLQYGAAPPLQSISRRALSFDLETRAIPL